MRDYRIAIVTPVATKKIVEKPVETVEKQGEVATKNNENVIFLTLTDSINTKESFGG